MRSCLVLLLLCALPIAAQTTAPAQKPSIPSVPVLSPADALQYAVAPYRDARSQPNDLTVQDKWALGISIVRATQLCRQLTAKGMPKPGPDLLDLGRLCDFGAQYQPARQALIAYLGLPHPPDKEAAYLLLGRIFISLHFPVAAESEAESLMDEYPYNADTNALIEQIISHAEGHNLNLVSDDTANRLVEEQLPFLLKALQAGRSTAPPANDAKAAKYPPVDPATALSDALRCAYQDKLNGKLKKEQDLVMQLAQIVASDQYAHSPELPAMQADLARYRSVGQPAPLLTLHGEALIAGRVPQPITISLRHRATILIPVVLWAPTSVVAVQSTLTSYADNLRDKSVAIDVVTSYAANTGDTDKPSAAIRQALKEMQKQFPPHTPLILLPDKDLRDFAVADYPTAVLIGPDGTIDYNHLLLATGDLRMLVKAYLKVEPHRQAKKPIAAVHLPKPSPKITPQ